MIGIKILTRKSNRILIFKHHKEEQQKPEACERTSYIYSLKWHLQHNNTSTHICRRELCNHDVMYTLLTISPI